MYILYRFRYYCVTLLVILIITGSYLANAQVVKNESAVKYKKYIICSKFVSEGVAVGDVNNNGKNDILAGDYWFESLC